MAVSLTAPEQAHYGQYYAAARKYHAMAGLTVNEFMDLLFGITQVESSGGTNPAAQWQLGYNYGGTAQGIAHGLTPRDWSQQIDGGARSLANDIRRAGSVSEGLKSYGPGGSGYAAEVLHFAGLRHLSLGPTIQQTIAKLLRKTKGVAQQCVAFVNEYLGMRGLAQIRGNAVALENMPGFHWARKGGRLRVGDVVELNTGDAFGHVAIFEGFKKTSKGVMLKLLGANQGPGWNLGRGLVRNVMLFPKSMLVGWLPVAGRVGKGASSKKGSSGFSLKKHWPLIAVGAGALFLVVEAAK